MARSELRRRVDALDNGGAAWTGPAIWVVLNPGETTADGIARWEAEHGPREPGQPSIIWRCVQTGVPRNADSWVR